MLTGLETTLPPVPADLRAFLTHQRDSRAYRRGLAVNLSFEGWTYATSSAIWNCTPGFVSQSNQRMRPMVCQVCCSSIVALAHFCATSNVMPCLCGSKRNIMGRFPRSASILKAPMGWWTNPITAIPICSMRPISPPKKPKPPTQSVLGPRLQPKKELLAVLEAEQAAIRSGALVVLSVDQCHLN